MKASEWTLNPFHSVLERINIKLLYQKTYYEADLYNKLLFRTFIQLNRKPTNSYKDSCYKLVLNIFVWQNFCYTIRFIIHELTVSLILASIENVNFLTEYPCTVLPTELDWRRISCDKKILVNVDKIKSNKLLVTVNIYSVNQI